MTYEKFSRGLDVVGALLWTAMLAASMWVLGEISFTTGETSTPLYTVAWFGEMALIFQAWEAWIKVAKHG